MYERFAKLSASHANGEMDDEISLAFKPFWINPLLIKLKILMTLEEIKVAEQNVIEWVEEYKNINLSLID
mgnify:CR=1 FL=1